MPFRYKAGLCAAALLGVAFLLRPDKCGMYLRQIAANASPVATHFAAQAKEAAKMEPSDWFNLQRSWPNASFDERAWLQTIEEAQLEATAAQRGGSAASQWIPQGSSNIPGRVNTLCAHPTDTNVVLAGYATGGIFKTTDGGDTWRPVFDAMPMLSISDITYSPSNPQVVYAATGDPQITLNPVNGFGIYKSTDGGESWAYLGLNDVGIITKVEVHPSNPLVLFASVQGNPSVRNDKRGVYRSTDGGATWQRIHYVSTQSGASDMVMNPVNPQILYVSYWERIRNNTESVNFGTDARIYKTTDGGNTWQQLTNGLPSGVLCRTGLCISPQQPDKLYAVYVDTLFRPQGFYKTTDAGASWSAMDIGSLNDLYGTFGWYFGKVRCNPYNDEEVYALGILMKRKATGATAWIVGAGAHADCHDIIFQSNGTRFLATDGGVFRNKAGQFQWDLAEMQTTQIYHIAYDPHRPNRWWMGAQDQGTSYGSAALGINNWQLRHGGDGFDVAFHGTDSNIVWVQTQNGGVHHSTDGGQNFLFRDNCLGTTDRCGWDVPIHKSTHNADFLYSATYRAYVSPVGSLISWSPISPDLTDGVIYGPRYHVVSTINESPVQFERLFAGTSDGNVWRSGTAGQWVNISAGLPDRFVTSVHGSPTQVSRIYVTHSGFRDGVYLPHIHRSDNNGATWVDISANLPQVPVNDLLIVPGHQDSVILAATDAGVYLTKNSAASWIRLGSNLPNVISVDLEWNAQNNTVAVATFGRGLYTMPIADVLAEQPPAAPVLTNIGAVRTAYPAPIAVNNVRLRVDNQPLALTNAMGFGTLTNAAPTGILTLSKDTLPTNGVDILDALQIQRHILGLTPLDSPYKLLAADVNNSRTITAADIVVLRKVILGAQTSFVPPSWQFVPSDVTFQNAQNPWLDSIPQFMPMAQIAAGRNPSWVAIKSGDVTGNAATQNAMPWVADDRDLEEMEVVLTHEFAPPRPSPKGREMASGLPIDASRSFSGRNESNSVLLSVPEAHVLAGMQGTIKTSEEIISIEPLDAPLAGSFRLVDKRTIVFCLLNAEQKLSAAPLLRITYKNQITKKKEQISNNPLANSLPLGEGRGGATWRLSHEVATKMAIDHAGNMRQLILQQHEADATEIVFPTLRIAANPHGVGQDLTVWLSGAGQAHINCFDAHGRLVYSGICHADTPTVVPGAALQSVGVYYLRVVADGKETAYRVVVL